MSTNNISSSKRATQYKGGFVLQPKPGLYKNVIVLDFRSLYPSIIVTHNISPETMNCKHKKCRKNKVPGFNRWFCKKVKGKIPEMVEKALKDREKIKNILKYKKLSKVKRGKLKQKEKQLKLVANIAYGKFSWSKSSYFCVECGEACAMWGRYYIKKSINRFKKGGFRIIYSDTDSLFCILKK